jgi:hypothetical protein
MPKGKAYTIYAEGCEDMKPGTKVQIMGEGVVGRDGMVTVKSFEAEGGPNAADKALEGMGAGLSAGLGMGEEEEE